MSRETAYLGAFTLACLAAMLLLPSVPQPAAYHDFADHRALAGIANALDVTSNLGFLLVAVVGFALVLRADTAFEFRAERAPYVVFFAGMLLTALGSAYYHLAPDNERLFWDRLPMTFAFVALIAAQIVERVSVRAGLLLLAPLLLLGAGTVVYWLATERAGAGNVVPYAILQVYAVVTLLLITWLHPSRYTHGSDLYWVFAGYVVAKLFETFDREVLALNHLVSGHTLKHLAAAAAGFVVCRMLRLRQLRRAGAGLLLALLALGCGPPISVRRVPAPQVSAELARSALNSSRPSLFSENVLHRWDLTALHRRDPAAALAALHERLRERLAGGQGGGRTLFALAELCFQHAERSRQREYSLAALVYAYAFLFPGPAAAPPEPLDPRVRIAADLYNRSLVAGFGAPRRGTIDLRTGVFKLPFGQKLVVRFDEASRIWANRRLDDFVPIAEMEVRGLGARFRSPGIGAPLAATMQPLAPEGGGTEDFVVTGMRVPATALLRIEQPRAQVTQPVIESSLRLYHHLDVDRVDIDGRAVPIEAEPSAALAYSLSESQVWSWERWGILRGDLVSREFERPLAFLEPYRPGRIPVVFVHGTASSPGRWANMLNVLMNDHRLRDRFQFWFFFYDTGNAIPYSALLLRQTLAGAVAQLDPDGRDAALREMVVVGHSQGGLLARLTAIDSGDRFWDAISTRPIDELDVRDETRALLRQVFIFEPLPFVRRLVFIATPHRGSFVAEYSLVNLLAGFVRLPQTLATATGDLVTGNADALRFDPRRRTFGAVYGMRPGNVFLVAMDTTSVAAGVTAHSIIPVRGGLPPAGQSDGVVDFASASLDWTESEFVIPRSGHSVQGNPLAIEEVRRILVEHADQACARDGFACRPAAAAR